MAEPYLILDPEYPEVLAEIARAVHHELMTNPIHKLEHEPAALIAMKTAEHVRRQVGGGPCYIPRGLNYELSLRDRQIWNEFDGFNYAEVARKHGVTEMRVRQIIAVIRREEVAKRQHDMFPV